MKTSGKKGFSLKTIHLQAIGILLIYSIISKINLYQSLLISSYYTSFLRVYLFGLIATLLFLYIFSHEDFFKIARDIEDEEDRREKKYVKQFKHLGKIIGSLAIGTLGGPVFAALTLRFFFHKKFIKYPLIFVITFLSTILIFFLGKGIIG